MNFLNKSKKRNRTAVILLFLTLFICIISAAAFFTDYATNQFKVTVAGADFDYTLSGAINNAKEVIITSSEEDVWLAVHEENTDSRDLFRYTKITAKWSKGTDINRVTFQNTNGTALSGVTYDKVAEEITIPLAHSTKIEADSGTTHYIKVILDRSNGANDTLNQDTLNFSVISDVSAVKDSWKETVGPVELKLHTKFTQSKYTVHYHANGGTGTMTDQEFIFGTAQNLNENKYSKTGYLFTGWALSDNGAAIYLDKQSVDNLTETNGDIINLYAVWKPITYTVKFHANGGSGSMNDLVMTYDIEKNLTANLFTWDGYDFLGWATRADSEVVYTDKQSVNNLISDNNGTVNLYAVWESKNLKVIYHANGGSFSNGTSINEVFYGESGIETKVSKTSNIGEDGALISSFGYGNYQNVKDTVTIDGAKSLTVTVTYETANYNWDYVMLFDGTVQNPSPYKDSESFSGRLGGTKGTKTYTVEGDTVVFCFKSDGSSNNYYGYYATVSATKTPVVSGVYEEPTNGGYIFEGWYTDPACTDGKEFDLSFASSGITVYAKWKEIVPMIQSWLASASSDFHRFKNIITEIEFSKTYDSSVTMDYGPWDVSAAQDKTVMAYRVGSKVYICANAGVPKNVVANPNSSNLFSDFAYVTSFHNMNFFDTSTATNMSNMFYNCARLPILDLSSFDTSNVTNMTGMFEYCSKLSTLNVSSFNTANVTNMGSMFQICGVSELDLSNFNTSKVFNMQSMFYGCGSLESLDLSSFDTSNVLYMDKMFVICDSLKEVNLSSFDTRKVTTMESMFQECYALEKLDLSNFKTPSLTNVYNMFSNCTVLSELDLSGFDTSNVTTLREMFALCKSLTEIDLSSFDVTNVTNTTNMFYGCTNLQTIYVNSNWNLQNVSSSDNMFYSSRKLVGGNGTKYISDSSSDVDKTYARIDTPSTPGYLTAKTATASLQLNLNGGEIIK